MPYKKHLPKTGCLVTHPRHQQSAATRLVALTLLLTGLSLLALPAAASSCRQFITSVTAAQELGSAVEPPAHGWVPVTLPDTWHTRWPDAQGAVWYQIKWHDECGGSEAVALRVSHLTMAGTIYLNDTLLWQDASLQEPFSRSWNMPRYWVLPAAALSGPDNTLWLRITGMRHDVLGLGQVEVGAPAVLWPKHTAQSWQKRGLFTLNMSISLVLGCLFLALWAVQRAERAYAWYALASLAWALFAASMLATTPWPFSNSADWNRAVTVVFIVHCTAFCLFTWHFGGQHFPRLRRALCTTTLALAAGLWWVPDTWLTGVLVAVIPSYSLIFISNCIQFQFHAWRQRERHNVLLALCLLFFIIVALHDLLLVMGAIGGDLLYSPVTSPISMIFMFLIIADRVASNLRRIETFNAQLYAAVEATREELTQTLQHKHQLETSNIRLTERLRLSHDLHDSLGSSLMRSIALVEQTNTPLSNQRFLSMLKELRSDLRQIIDNSSSSAAVHRTPAEWLAPLRHRFVRLFEELGMSSRWRIPASWPSPRTSVQLLALTRFLEEALTNALKHSRGTHFEISLQGTDQGGITLCVQDNGVGFDIELVSNGSGVGLRSMRARLERIGGRLTLHSQPGGTRLVASLGNVAADATAAARAPSALEGIPSAD